MYMYVVSFIHVKLLHNMPWVDFYLLFMTVKCSSSETFGYYSWRSKFTNVKCWSGRLCFLFLRGIITLDQASSLTTTLFDQAKPTLKPKSQQVFEDRRRQLKITVDTTIQELQTLTIRSVIQTAKKNFLWIVVLFEYM